MVGRKHSKTELAILAGMLVCIIIGVTTAVWSGEKSAPTVQDFPPVGKYGMLLCVPQGGKEGDTLEIYLANSTLMNCQPTQPSRILVLRPEGDKGMCGRVDACLNPGTATEIKVMGPPPFGQVDLWSYWAKTRDGSGSEVRGEGRIILKAENDFSAVVLVVSRLATYGLMIERPDSVGPLAK
ncbi:MAG: hypothetical protein WC702_03060 [Patescibacteria group bacterium]|jgi:hypothetical protein